MPSFPAGWRVSEDGKRVGLSVKTADFLAALDLFRAVGEIAERLEHHPDLHLERWNEVRLECYSHDVGALTERDERLVAEIHRLLLARGLVG